MSDKPLDLDAIRRMTPEQINQDWERVAAVLSGKPAIPADLQNADPDTLAQAVTAGRWPEVAAEMERRAQAQAEQAQAERAEVDARHAAWLAEQNRPRHDDDYLEEIRHRSWTSGIGR